MNISSATAHPMTHVPSAAMRHRADSDGDGLTGAAALADGDAAARAAKTSPAAQATQPSPAAQAVQAAQVATAPSAAATAEAAKSVDIRV